MALNFPTNPAAQTPINTYSPTSTPDTNTDNNLTYVFDGVKWTTSGSPPFLMKSGGTMTGTLTVPTLNATDTTTGTLATGSLNGGPLAGARNRIINGDMRINQRNAVVSTTATYTIDRWGLYFSNGGTVQVSQSQDAPSTFTHSLLFDITGVDSSVAVGDYAYVVQFIEGLNTSDLAWGTSSAQTVTLSFWVKSTATGTYCVSLGNGAGNRSYVSEYTISMANTWQKKTITVPGDTSGTWLTDTGKGMSVRFTFMCGTNYQTTPNAWVTGNYVGTNGQTNLYSSTSNECRITGVQLETGNTTTPFERRSYTTELTLCQRYCWVFGNTNNSIFGTGYEDNQIGRVVSSLPVTMRSSPTLQSSSLASTFVVVDKGNTGRTGTDIAMSFSSPTSVVIDLTFGGESGNDGDGCFLRTTSGSANMVFDAEL